MHDLPKCGHSVAPRCADRPRSNQIHAKEGCGLEAGPPTGGRSGAEVGPDVGFRVFAAGPCADVAVRSRRNPWSDR
jgi:hypothetical protein